jgi:hypothetical protein
VSDVEIMVVSTATSTNGRAHAPSVSEYSSTSWREKTGPPG